MKETTNLLKSIVPISALNRGGAMKIIESLNDGPKVIMKNNHPVAILLSPEEYNQLISNKNNK